jgi:pyruvate formate lyase activating enzyme
MKEASFYTSLNDGLVQCELCPHLCTIFPGERGKCGVRENKSGKLYSLVYSRLASAAVDPIEKKPLFGFHPGEKAFSVATVGCNFSCEFCQNCTLSQAPKPGNSVEGRIVSPEHIVRLAVEARCNIIAYTYSEPTIALEYWMDTMRFAKSKGLFNVFVTNGFINPQPLRAVSKFLDAANIDLKSFSEGFYEKHAGGKLKPVLDAIRLYYELGVHIELTTLVIPELNDSEAELGQIARFISDLDSNTHWHITRFFPSYNLRSIQPTPIETLKSAQAIAHRAGLKNVHLGNV